MCVLFAIGPGFINVILLLAVGRWPVYARAAPGMSLSIREAPYSEAARARLLAGTGDVPARAPQHGFALLVLGTLEIATL